MGQTDDSIAKPFTMRQRRGAMVFCAILIVITAIGLLSNRSFVDDPIPNQAERYLELQDRIDPNTADASLLAALPALGERRALDIVEFREKMQQGDPNRVVFRKLDDLMQIKGLGIAITRQLQPYLRFPESATTHPEM